MDSSPTALFDSYEQDFQQFIESVRDKLEGSGKDEVGGAYFSLSLSLGPHIHLAYLGNFAMQNNAKRLYED